ncbi:flagellar basal body P-ring biosynthesis protein FlgA [Actinomyces viscosus]|uniref:Flagellar basal body P-ring biosynthesis protein FlgA n=1 Tax=Actinomyces viscosus TaxID=1656 RepID=A0A3S4VCA6_ACTVI|nr:flagellar basal body P-ring biosynthesis protein FlgA [Actinomyces viscosus]
MRLHRRLSRRHESRQGSHRPSPRSTRSAGRAAQTSSHGARPTAPRPSVLLWRHRHLVVALCLGTAVLVALSVLRPGPERGQEVLVAARQVSAGAVITEQDVSTSRLPTSALPSSGLASKDQVVGTRAAIALEPGTVLTTPMTSGNIAQQLGSDERLVQVPVDVGAELARPGARVDVIGQASQDWSPQAASPQGQDGATADEADGQGKDSSAPANTENSSTNAPSSAPGTPSSSPDQESPGSQKSSQSLSQGMSVGTFGAHSTVLCSGARVVMTQQAGEESRWTGNKKVTLITLAIPAGSAILVVGAATNSTLGIALSP